MVRKFRELLPPTSNAMIAPAGTTARNSENVAPRLLAKFFEGYGCLLGMPRLPSRSKRRLRGVGNREQVRLHGHRFVPDAAERNSENLCPPALFREIPSCSVSLRRCVAVHKIAPPSGAPYTGARDPRPEIGGMNGWQPWVDAHSSRKLAPPRREDRFAAIVRRLRNVQVFPPNASRK
jgi:hypothetical protein